MGDNAALANEFELPFCDLTPTEREMLGDIVGSSEQAVLYGFSAGTFSASASLPCHPVVAARAQYYYYE
ncbi:hypothetical protein HPB47_012099 [Ixodes persulcatus]|uniref:Uncharacterized protein n=1 Tax=Ixodes persulcatus TaxID=34615 RepID=A0AC60NUE2_IXOPE|nr:hypothetical protein HPB47_012099 [Ixodes persulcatus]